MDTPFKQFDPQSLYFIPLGGASEFGGVFNAYCFQGKWLLVDCGLFLENEEIGIAQQAYPDPAFIEQYRDDIVGLVITHAHDDHIGAVAALWPRLKCPVYASRIACAYLRNKVKDFPDAEDMILHTVYAEDIFELGPYLLRILPVTHSIPEASMIEIKTALGTVIHTGDWKIDYDPVVGAPINERMFETIGQHGVLAVVGDSTNAPLEDFSGDEADVRDGLIALFARCNRKIIITCQSRHIARIHSIALAAKACGRQVVLAGRSMWTFDSIARDLEYHKGVPLFLNAKKASRLPQNDLVYIVTGSQGETNAVLSRIAVGEYNDVTLQKGDHVIFSSLDIPPCRPAINRLREQLSDAGAEVITRYNCKDKIYTSGHPSQKDISLMYGWLKPKVVIAVHGEDVQLNAHQTLAKTCKSIEHTLIPHDGGIVKIAPGEPEVIGHVKTGVLRIVT